MAGCLIKICGIKKAGHALAAAHAGADLIGFVFFNKSPRHITPEAASDIVLEVKETAFNEGFDPPRFVGLFVDAGEKLLAEAAPLLSFFQFHGHEDARRIAEIGDAFGVQIIKAASVGADADFTAIDEIADVADMLLFDAIPPKGAARPGGHGEPFNWELLKRYRRETPFLLAGGLDAGNVAGAIAIVKGCPAFAGVDVSSGVETAPGVKDDGLIAAFVAAARNAI